MLLFAASVSALAAPEYAVMFPKRPPTLPKNDVNITVNAQVDPTSPVGASLLAGAAVGVTDQLEIGAWLVPLAIAPDFAYLDPSIYAAYGGRLSKTVTLTPLLRLFVPLTGNGGTVLDAQAKLGLDVGKNALFTVAPSATFAFADGGPATGIGAPVTLAIQPDRRFFLLFESGIGTDPFEWQYDRSFPGAATDFAVPLGARIGTAAGKPKKGAVVDLSAGVYWPAFATDAGIDADGLTVVAEISTNILGDKGKGKGKGKGGKGKGKGKGGKGKR